jgi:uncharacterized protein
MKEKNKVKNTRKLKDLNELLKLARESIFSKINGKNLVVSDIIKEKFNEKGACFVTLTIDGNLRGCIGTLEAHEPLYIDVINNAVNAGFFDPRFTQLDSEEFNKIKIEISILSKPEKLGKGIEVFDKIDKNMGIILKKGFSSATFLPQVWEELNDKTEFLEHLSRKAGLYSDSWKDAELWFYRVEKVKEK